MLRIVEERFAGPCSTITPPSMNSTRSATSLVKAISWVTTTMVMPSSASLRMTPKNVADQFGIQRRGRLVEQDRLRLHRERAGNRDALLLSAGYVLQWTSAFSASPTRASSARPRSSASARGSFFT